jgi:predicted nucleic acid-binding protein
VIVLDTTVLIDLLRGLAPARDYLRGLDAVPACSEVSRVEVLRGLRHRERDAADALMRTMTWIPVDEQIARRAGSLGREWRRSHAVGTVDLIVAATAQELGAELVTSNVRHFPMFPNLAPPYR